MSSPRLVQSVLLLLLVCVSLTEALRGSGPKKCCFKFNDSPLPRNRVMSYMRTSQRCSNPAVLLRTVAGRQLCVRPSDSWVKELLGSLDAAAASGGTSPL